MEKIIRVGSTGALREDLALNDLIIPMAACTDSNYQYHYKMPGQFSPTASFRLLRNAVELSEARNITYHVGNILTSDVFYFDNMIRIALLL